MESSDQYKTPKKHLLNQQSFLRIFNTSSEPVNISITSQSQNNSHSRKINFSVLPANKTTPTNNIRKVFNPFEAALTDRLHLPLIGSSPSLFQRPSTPQYSSTQFEWTIEDVSSLGPANVEPHETQFNGSPDPEIEAKAQAAISSFFNEQKIVPSPLIDGQIRSQQIILTEVSNKTPMKMKAKKTTRDGSAQTILSLPPVLPPDLESVLKPFFNYFENQQQKPAIFNSSTMSIDHEARDASLRRKLFDHHYYTDDTVSSDDICKFDEFSPPPKSPEINTQSLNNSINKNSFGSLSPISKLESPNKCSQNIGKHGFIDVSVTISPISKTQSQQCIVVQSNSYRTNEINDISIEINNFKGNDTKKSPLTSFLTGRSSSPSFGETSIDSNLNRRVKLLGMSCSKRFDKKKSMIDNDILSEDEMQISQGSTRSSLSSDSFTLNFTPRSKKRAANRKNLSHSFSFNLSDNEENQLSESSKIILSSLDDLLYPLAKKPLIYIGENSGKEPKTLDINEKSTFHRTDSGFNEISNTQEDMKFNNKQNFDLKNSELIGQFDVSINENNIEIIPFCSTPSKNPKQNTYHN